MATMRPAISAARFRLARASAAADRGLAAGAVVLFIVLGAGLLVTRNYSVTRCYSNPGGFGGCDWSTVAFSREALPALIGPLIVLGLLVALAIVAWRARGSATGRLAASLAVLLAGAPLLGVGWPLLVPVLLLIAAALLAARIAPREVAIDLALAAAIVLAAFGVGYLVLLVATAYLGVGGAGGWIYLAFATALGFGLGLGDAGAGRRRPLVRGLVCAYTGAGSGLLVALLLLRPVMFPDGQYLNVGLGGMYLALLSLGAGGLVMGTLAVRVILRRGWRDAAVIALGAALSFPVFVAATGVFAGAFAPAAQLEPPPLLRLPRLPGTATD